MTGRVGARGVGELLAICSLLFDADFDVVSLSLQLRFRSFDKQTNSVKYGGFGHGTNVSRGRTGNGSRCVLILLFTLILF